MDMWSFGVVLWEIVTQEIPRRGQLRQLRCPDECPQAIADLLDDCHALNPKKRPSAEEVCCCLVPLPSMV